jgi:hypothetical protein
MPPLITRQTQTRIGVRLRFLMPEPVADCGSPGIERALGLLGMIPASVPVPPQGLCGDRCLTHVLVRAGHLRPNTRLVIAIAETIEEHEEKARRCRP